MHSLYGSEFLYCTVYHVFTVCPCVYEVYEARRWHDDPQYQAPMIITEDGSHIFVGDIVETTGCIHSHVKFMTKVYRAIFMLLLYQ